MSWRGRHLLKLTTAAIGAIFDAALMKQQASLVDLEAEKELLVELGKLIPGLDSPNFEKENFFKQNGLNQNSKYLTNETSIRHENEKKGITKRTTNIEVKKNSDIL